MISLLRSHTPKLPSNISGMRMKKYTIQGDAPFNKLSFVTHQVYELNGYLFCSDQAKDAFVQHFLTIPSSFELWFIPSVFNAKKLFNNMERKMKDIPLLQKQIIVKGSQQVERQFLVVNRLEAKPVLEKVKDLGISFHEVPETVAKIIKVKYEVEGQKRHE